MKEPIFILPHKSPNLEESCFVNALISFVTMTSNMDTKKISVDSCCKGQILFSTSLPPKQILLFVLYSMNIGGSIRLNPYGLLVLGLMSLFILYYTFGSSTKLEEKISMKVLLSAAIDIAKKGGDQVRFIREQVK